MTVTPLSSLRCLRIGLFSSKNSACMCAHARVRVHTCVNICSTAGGWGLLW